MFPIARRALVLALLPVGLAAQAGTTPPPTGAVALPVAPTPAPKPPM